MKIIDLDQHSDAWISWRKAGIGASEASSIAVDAGLVQPASWTDTTQELWEKKLGLREQTAWNPAMQRGTDGEDLAAAHYTKRTGNMISPLCAEMDDLPFIHASFDGISWEGDLITEIKCPSQKVFDMAKKGIVVGYYKPQLAQQALVAWGHPDTWNLSNRVHFFCYIPETDEGALVEMTAADIKELALSLLPKLVEFWAHIENKTPPCGDMWIAAAKRFIVAENELAEAKANHELARLRMITMLPMGKTTQNGGGVTVTKVKGQIDYTTLMLANNIALDVAELYRTEGSIDYPALVADAKLPEEQIKRFRSVGEIDYESLVETQGIEAEVVEKFRGDSGKYRVVANKPKATKTEAALV